MAKFDPDRWLSACRACGREFADGEELVIAWRPAEGSRGGACCTKCGEDAAPGADFKGSGVRVIRRTAGLS